MDYGLIFGLGSGLIASVSRNLQKTAMLQHCIVVACFNWTANAMQCTEGFVL
jgi:membrane-associated PAP2 superfamily phosphatase